MFPFYCVSGKLTLSAEQHLNCGGAKNTSYLLKRNLLPLLSSYIPFSAFYMSNLFAK